MANTATTTPINLRIVGLGALASLLVFFSLANIFATLTPVKRLNDRIAEAIPAADAQEPAARLQSLTELRRQQEWALARKPADPFAWARLAYLRLATLNDPRAAFAALQMSDIISPGEPRALPERAVFWWQLRDVETAEQRDYQATLWAKAFSLNRDLTWKTARQYGLVKEAGEALQKSAPDLYEEWKERVQSQPKPLAAP